MEKNNSFWLDNFKLEKFNKLEEDMKVDVCIVGGGLSGITTAYYLSKKGYKVALIEKEKLLSETSGHTTAKITSQHSIFYDYLIKSQGKEFAKKYLEVNENAIINIKNIINEENIDCDFEEKSAYIFTENEDEVPEIKDEVKAVKELNIVKCEFLNHIDDDLKLNIKGAIKFEKQAQFNPIKYANGLVKRIIDLGGKIFENTKFEEYKKDNGEFEIFTNTKNIIKSKYLVLTTRYPIVNFPGYYFIKMYQEMSYVIAIKPKKNIKLDGMYISNKSPKISIKTANLNGESVILFGGYGNKTGEIVGIENKYQELLSRAFEIFGDFDCLCKWNTEDCISLDKIPYIGEFSNFTNNLFVATGFEKWGMTTSNVAGKIICDEISGETNEYKDIFKATRINPIKNNDEIKNMIKQSVKSLVVDKLKSSKEVLDDVENDEGKIVMFGDKKVGIYKDKDGNVYAINPVCTHLGCELSWNNLNKTWDCPCHGSRFEYTGKCIYSPAIKNLENYNFE